MHTPAPWQLAEYEAYLGYDCMTARDEWLAGVRGNIRSTADFLKQIDAIMSDYQNGEYGHLLDAARKLGRDGRDTLRTVFDAADSMEDQQRGPTGQNTP